MTDQCRPISSKNPNPDNPFIVPACEAPAYEGGPVVKLDSYTGPKDSVPAVPLQNPVDQLAVTMKATRERHQELLNNKAPRTADTIPLEEIDAWNQDQQTGQLQAEIAAMTGKLQAGQTYSLKANFSQLPTPMQEAMREYRDEEDIYFRYEMKEVAGAAAVPSILFLHKSALLKNFFGTTPKGDFTSMGKAPVKVFMPEGKSLVQTGGPKPTPQQPGPLTTVYQVGGIVGIVAMVDYSIAKLDLPEPYQGRARAGGSLLLFEGARRLGMIPNFQWGPALEGMPMFTGLNLAAAYGLDAAGVEMGTDANTYGSLGLSLYTYTKVLPALAADYPAFNAAWQSTRALTTNGELMASSGWSLNAGRLGRIFRAPGWTGITGSTGAKVMGGTLQAANAALAVWLGDALGGAVVDWVADDGSPHYRLLQAAFDSVVHESNSEVPVLGHVGNVFSNVSKGMWTIPTIFSDDCYEALYGDYGAISMRENEWTDASRVFSLDIKDNMLEVALSTVDVRDKTPTFDAFEFQRRLRGRYGSWTKEQFENSQYLLKLTKHRDSDIQLGYSVMGKGGSAINNERLDKELQAQATAELKRVQQQWEQRKLELGLSKRVGDKIVAVSFTSINELTPAQRTFLVGEGREPSEGVRLKSRLKALEVIIKAHQPA